MSCCESCTASDSTLKFLFIAPIQIKLMHFEEVKAEWMISNDAENN